MILSPGSGFQEGVAVKQGRVDQLFLRVFTHRLNFSLSEDDDANALVLDLAVYR